MATPNEEKKIPVEAVQELADKAPQEASSYTYQEALPTAELG